MVSRQLMRRIVRARRLRAPEAGREWVPAEVYRACCEERERLASKLAALSLDRIADGLATHPAPAPDDAAALRAQVDEMRAALRAVGIFRSDEAGDDGSEWCVTAEPRGEEPVGALEEALRYFAQLAYNDGQQEHHARYMRVLTNNERISDLLSDQLALTATALAAARAREGAVEQRANEYADALHRIGALVGSSPGTRIANNWRDVERVVRERDEARAREGALERAHAAWEEYAEHAAGCVECGETSWANCHDGKELRAAAEEANAALRPARDGEGRGEG